MHLFLSQHVPLFWKEICYHWFDYKHKRYGKEKEIETQIIWCNSYIRIANKPILNKTCITNGLLYLSQLIENGKWVMPYKAKNNYGLQWYLYKQIQQATPKQWVRDLQNTKVTNVTSQSVFDEHKTKKKVVNHVYNVLVDMEENSKMIEYKLSKKGVTLLPQEITEAFKRITSTTNIVKYRDFQYRLLTGSIFTNDQLYYWGKTPTQACEWCGSPKQTIRHLLYECPWSQTLWSNITRMLKQLNETFREPTYEQIYAGMVCKTKRPDHRIFVFIYKTVSVCL